MDDHFKKTTIPLSAFIIKQCRKFRLFHNESTTVLSRGDEMQVMQFCLACQSKKNGDQLEADPSVAVMLVDRIRRSAVVSIEYAVLKAQNEQEIWPDNHVVVGEIGDNVAAASPPACKSVAISENNHGRYTDRLLEEIQSNIQDKGTSLKDGQTCDDSTELHNDTCHSSTMEASVLDLFHEYKDTNNHCTLMDVYSAFMRAGLDHTSDLRKAVAANEDVHKLVTDMEYCCIMQTKVIGFLQGICNVLGTACSAVQNVIVSSDIPEKIQLPSLAASQLALILSPKTPVGKIKAAAYSRERSPSQTPKTPISPSSGRDLKEIFVEDLFRSYMHLLVNSRSQLALARVFNIPDRGLDHGAFTHLKHEASVCGLSMYQTLSSFMLRIHLGGQGYAPTKDNPLLAYVKGLGSLLDMTQKLHTIVEEEYDLSAACSRVVNVIRISLIRCKSGKFPSKLVTPVSEKIHDKLSAIIPEMESLNSSKPSQTASTGTSMLGRRGLLVIQQFLDRTALSESQLDVLLMSDICLSSSSPSRFPCLLTQFRSPSIMDVQDKDDDNSIAKSIPLRSVPRSGKHFVSAALYVDSDQTSELLLTQRTMSSIEILPSKTIIHPRADVSVQTSHKETGASTLSNARNEVNKCTKSKGDKRPATSLLDKENMISSPLAQQKQKMKRGEPSLNTAEDSPVSSRQTSSQEISTSKTRKSVKSCRRRLLTQIKGQGKITGFFRM